MMIVRFTSGMSVQYNDAYYIDWNSNGNYLLYNKDPENGGKLIARIPHGHDRWIEWQRPCEVKPPWNEPKPYDLKSMAETLLAGMERAHDYSLNCSLKKLKERLKRLNCKTLSWKR